MKFISTSRSRSLLTHAPAIVIDFIMIGVDGLSLLVGTFEQPIAAVSAAVLCGLPRCR